MISKDDVIMAYRLIMGREPESDQVIAGHAAQFDNLRSLRAGFMASDEFRLLLKQPLLTPGNLGVKPLNWPSASVEVDVPPEFNCQTCIASPRQFKNASSIQLKVVVCLPLSYSPNIGEYEKSCTERLSGIFFS